MTTRAVVFPARSTSEPFLLHADKNEICTLNAGAVALIVFKGSFEMLLPAERKFVPLPADFDTTKLNWIMGVEDVNEAIVLEKASSNAEERKVIQVQEVTKPLPRVEERKTFSPRVLEELSPDETISILSREEPKRKAHVEEEPIRKRLQLESPVSQEAPVDGVAAVDWSRVVIKANKDLAGAVLIVQLPNMCEYSAIIHQVVCNTLNSLCFMVKETPESMPMRAMNWIRGKTGDAIKPGSSDQTWWEHAWVKRTHVMRLCNVIPWNVKVRKDKQAIMMYLDTPIIL